MKLRLVKLLLESKGGLSAQDIADTLIIPRSNVYRHFAVIEKAGFEIFARKEGENLNSKTVFKLFVGEPVLEGFVPWHSTFTIRPKSKTEKSRARGLGRYA
jgi:biotin operon repressor